MRRSLLLCFVVLGLACDKPPSASTADAPTADETPADSKQADAKQDASAAGCQALGDEKTASIRLVSQGSHADARADLTLDLGAARMSGSDYELDGGSTPVPLKVDQAVKPEVIEAFRAALADTCAERKKFEEDQQQAPGGYTVLQLTQADGSTLWVGTGSASIKAPGELATITRDQWKALMAAWPETEGKR